MTPPENRRILSAMRWPVGGVRSYVLYSYPLLMDAGFRFTLLGPDCNTFTRLSEELAGWPDVRFVRAPKRGKRFRFLKTIRQELRTGAYAAIHTQGVTLGALATLSRLGLQTPHVCTSHYTFQSARTLLGVKGWVQRLVLSFLLGQADVLITVSNDAYEDHLNALPRIARSRCRLIAIRNGVDVTRLTQEIAVRPRDLHARLGLSGETTILGFFGRFMPEKGFPLLLTALDLLLSAEPNLPIHLIAVGSGDYEREYKRDVNTSERLINRVTFLPFVNNVAALLRQVDLVVIPSLGEACCLLAMEAMCVGTPVLGAQCIGLREILKDTPSRTVQAGSAAALADGIREAINHPFTYESGQFIGEARKRFDIATPSERLRDVFVDLVNSSY